MTTENLVEERRMKPEAIANDKASGATLFAVKEIYLNHDFNCRERFSVIDILPLADDISKQGLLQPIILRPLRTEDRKGLPNEKELMAKGYRYHVIAGHRRLTAYRVNNAEVIPGILKDAYLSPFELNDINAIENLHRADLTMWEEAMSIRHYWVASWTGKEIAEKISKTYGWVQPRLFLLQLPKEIQQMAHKGDLTQENIRKIYEKRHDREELLKFAATIRDKRKRGVTGSRVYEGMQKKKQGLKKSMRTKTEIQEMMTVVQETLKHAAIKHVPMRDLVSEQGNCFATTFAAWCCGNISEVEFHIRFKKYAALFRCDYQMPEFESETLNAVF